MLKSRSAAQIPRVIARQIDVSPAQRRQIAKLLVGYFPALSFEVVDDRREIRRIPQGNGGDDEIEPARLIKLRF